MKSIPLATLKKEANAQGRSPVRMRICQRVETAI